MIVVRTACATDDLTILWPALGRTKLNLEQVIVAVDPDKNDELLGGSIVWHAGHEVAYVGELTLCPNVKARRTVAAKIVGNVLTWAVHHGCPTLVFTVFDPHFAALCLKAGAKVLGTPLMLAAYVQPGETE